MTSGDDGIFGQIKMLFAVDGIALASVQQWTVSSNETRAWKCLVTNVFVFVRVADIACPLIWAGRDSLYKTVLKPLRS